MVEWKKLGDICEVSNGERPVSEILEEGLYPYINAGRTNSGFLSEFNSNGEAVTTPSHGEGGIGSVLYQNSKFWCGALCYRMYTYSGINSRYLFHYLSNNADAIISCKNIGGQPYINRKQLENIPIGVPSLEEQTRIVGILDTFTSAIDNLKEQIAQRRKQYEYYRDQLLDLEGKPGVEMKTLGELSYKISSGRNKNKEDQGLYPVFGSTGIIAYTNSYLFDKPLILVARVGANAGYVYMINEKCDVTDNTLIVETKEDNNRKFIYYYLVYMNINQFAKGGGQPLITGGLLKGLLIPLPPLSEQQRIVSILDTFEASIQNLEAQLKQREKQYEYYRNKLLSFE